METQQLKSSEQEIDLLYYMRMLKSSLYSFSIRTKDYFRSLWRNKFVFLLIVLLITGAAYSIRYVIPPAYRTEGMFISHYLPAHYYEIMIRDLDEMLDDKNIPVVAEQLNIAPNIASEIRHLDLVPLRDTIFERNDTVFAPFRLTLLLKEIDHVAALQEGIIYYLQGGQQEQKRLASLNGRTASRLNGTELPKIEILRPILKRTTYNYPNYNKFLMWGFLIALVIAMMLAPQFRKKRIDSV